MPRLTIVCFYVTLGTLLSAQVSAPGTPKAFRINGTVVNALTGQALSNIRVSIGPAQGSDPPKTVASTEDGHFDFENLAAGKYWLAAQGRGFSSQRLDEHDQFSTAIAVGPGRDSEGLIFHLSPDAAIVGTITDEQNDMVSDAQIILFRTGLQNGSPSTQIRGQASTDDQGRYHFGRVAPGSYYIGVSARPWYAEHQNSFRSVVGQAPTTEQTEAEENQQSQFDVTYPLTFYPGVTDAASATPLTVKPGDRVTADVGLTAVPSLHLHVTDSDIQAQQGINATLIEQVFGTSIPLSTEVNVIGPGQIEISGVSPGQYALTMQTYGKDPVAREKQIEISASSDVDIADSPPLPFITGIVELETGIPLPHSATVVLLGQSDQNVSAQMSANGEFVIPTDRARLAKYQVAVFGIRDTFVKSVSATGANVSGRELQLSGSTPVRLKIVLSQGTGRVDGTALRDGKPVAGAMIVLVPQDIEHNSVLVRRDQSDSDGTFSLYDVLPGSYTVLAIQNGWDLPWRSPSVLQPYLKAGTVANVAARGRYDIKVNAQ